MTTQSPEWKPIESIVDKNAIIDLISDAISDSFGPDWTPSDAAYAVMQWLEDEGLMFVKKPTPENAGDPA